MRRILLTDAPPLAAGGLGNFTISCNLVNLLRDHLAGVITHRYRRIDPKVVRNSVPAPCWIHGDFSWVAAVASFRAVVEDSGLLDRHFRSAVLTLDLLGSDLETALNELAESANRLSVAAVERSNLP